MREREDLDTEWFAIDEDGIIGLFDTSARGVIPVPADRPEWVHSPEPIHPNEFLKMRGPNWITYHDLKPYTKEQVDLNEFMDWPPEDFYSVEALAGDETRPLIEYVFLLFKSLESIPEELKKRSWILETTHGPLIMESYFDYELFKRLHVEERLKRVWTRSQHAQFDLLHYEWQWKYTGVCVYQNIHDNSTRRPYIPFNKPHRPLTLDDLPEPLRQELKAVNIPNISFRDHEAWNPFESFQNCFAYRETHIYQGADNYTYFPLPNRRKLWSELDLFNACDFWDWELYEDDFYPTKYGLDDITRKRFFATDAAGNIAIFNANPFGAYPAALRSIIASRPWEPTSPWDSFLRYYSVWPQARELPFDLSGLEEMPWEVFNRGKENPKRRVPGPFLALLTEPPPKFEYSMHLIRIPDPEGGPSTRILSSSYYRGDLLSGASELEGIDKIEKIWWAGWASHWMENSFGPITPRRFGFYHYDMSFLHAGPYARIAVPKTPANITHLPVDLVQAMNPVHIPGVDFSQLTMIQPMEHLDCLSDAPFWIDSALTRVRPTPSGREPLDAARESRILRRAHAHYQMIAELGREPRS